MSQYACTQCGSRTDSTMTLLTLGAGLLPGTTTTTFSEDSSAGCAPLHLQSVGLVP